MFKITVYLKNGGPTRIFDEVVSMGVNKDMDMITITGTGGDFFIPREDIQLIFSIKVPEVVEGEKDGD